MLDGNLKVPDHSAVEITLTFLILSDIHLPLELNYSRDDLVQMNKTAQQLKTSAIVLFALKLKRNALAAKLGLPLRGWRKNVKRLAFYSGGLLGTIGRQVATVNPKLTEGRKCFTEHCR